MEAKFLLKKDIKKLVQLQRELKNQRKTVNLVGERVYEPWEASYKHFANREKLRLMYTAYGVLRGKTYSQIENTCEGPNETHPLYKYESKINKIIKDYEKKALCYN